MVSAMAGIAGLNYLRHLLQTPAKHAGASTDKIFNSSDTNGDSSISKSGSSSALSVSSLASQVLGSENDSTSALLGLLEALTRAITSITGPGDADSADSLSAEEMFAKADANGDGGLDKTEFENGRPSDMTVAQADKLYSRLDADNDGSISKTEFTVNGPGGPNGPPPPPPSSDSTSSTTNSGSGSDVLSAASLLMQAIEKYVAYNQSSAVKAATGSLAVTA